MIAEHPSILWRFSLNMIFVMLISFYISGCTSAGTDRPNVVTVNEKAPLPLIWTGKQSQAKKLVALVIGNYDYHYIEKLTSPRNDAIDFSQLVTHFGYELVGNSPKFNLTSKEIRASLEAAVASSANAENFLFYFSGHGFLNDYTNSLGSIDTPADGKAKNDITVDEIFRTLSKSTAFNRIFIFDMCRNTLGNQQNDRSRFARLPDPPARSIIGFSAALAQQSFGSVRLPGEEPSRNSVYTKNLIDAIISYPFATMDAIFEQTAKKTEKDIGNLSHHGDVVSNYQQTPTYTGSIYSIGTIQFIPGVTGVININAISSRPTYCRKVMHQYRDICYLASSGYTEFQFLLSELFHTGNFVDKADEDESIFWAKTAASGGNSAARFSLAMSLLDVSDKSAYEYLLPLANHHYAVASLLIGNAIRFGEIKGPEKSQAEHYLRRAANQGSTDALYELAVMSRDGEIIERDVSQAVFLSQEAAARGNDLAMILLGDLYYDTRNGMENQQLAIEYFERAINAIEKKFEEEKNYEDIIDLKKEVLSARLVPYIRLKSILSSPNYLCCSTYKISKLDRMIAIRFKGRIIDF